MTSSLDHGSDIAPESIDQVALRSQPGVAATSRTTLGLAVAIGAVAAVLYGFLVANTVQGGDSGELAAVALRLGVAHPPGYPLWSWMAHLLGQIPAGTPVWRVGLMSALSSGVALGALFYALRRLGMGWLSCAIGAAALALSPTFVWLAAVPEVFALHVAICALLVALAAACAHRGERPPTARAVALGLLLGLGFSNHHTIVLLFPLLLWMSVQLLRGNPERGKTVLLGTAALCLALLNYAYLVGAGLQGGWPRWGGTGELPYLVDHVLRRDYGTFELGLWRGEAGPWEHLGALFERTVDELGVSTCGLALLGALVATLHPRAASYRFLALSAVGTWLLAGPVFHAQFNLPASSAGAEIAGRFGLLPNLFVAAFAAAGAEALRLIGGDSSKPCARPSRGLPSQPARRSALRCPPHPLLAAPATRRAVVALRWCGTLALLAIVLVRGGIGLPDAAPARHRLAEAYGRDLLAPLPADAVLFTSGDLEYSVVTYLKEALRVRPDVRAIHLGLLGYEWYVSEMRRRAPELIVPFTAGQARSREILTSAHRVGLRVFVTRAAAGGLAPGDRVAPFGLAVEVLPPWEPTPPPAAIETIQRDILQRVEARGPLPTVRLTPSESPLVEAYASGLEQVAHAYDHQGDSSSAIRCRAAASRLRALVAPGTAHAQGP